MRLLVVAHCGVGVHRGAESTESVLRKEFVWPTLKDDVRDFVSNCIHCMMAKTGHKVLRPMAEMLHAEKPNDVDHFDFLYMGPGHDDFKYKLVLKGDLSSYIWLRRANTADAPTAAAEMSAWIRTSCAMRVWVSDQGTHGTTRVELSYSTSVRCCVLTLGTRNS